MKRIRTVLVTLFVVALVYQVYTSNTDVKSRSQSLSILSENGFVNTSNGILVFTPYEDVEGLSKEILQSLELQSKYFHIYISN